MRFAKVFVQSELAGTLSELVKGESYEFRYLDKYMGSPVSLALPVRPESYSFSSFPAFFDGLLPEGILLDSLLRKRKIDRNDSFSQLLVVGEDLVGDVTVFPV